MCSLASAHSQARTCMLQPHHMHAQQRIPARTTVPRAPPKPSVSSTVVRRSSPASASSAAAGQPSREGHCWLVGAGPGDPEFLTLKAVKALEQAEVVVYDDLGAQEALQYAPASAEAVYVGKRGGKASFKQSAIDQLLVQHVQQGRRVVRLKGGCPAVFSRVSSEAAALTTAGCSWELVPGVSSALAAPLLAGFPLTDASLSTSFAVVSGHAPDTIDWSAFSKVPTLVVLMGGRALPVIVRQLVEGGKAPDTPVCIIHAASTPQQQQWHSTLSAVVDDTAGVELSPCILVVGQVTTLPHHWRGQQEGGDPAGL